MLDMDKKFEELIGWGQQLSNEGEAHSWSERVRELLYQIYGRDVADEFEAVRRSRSGSWPNALYAQIGMLEGVAIKSAQNSTAMSDLERGIPAEFSTPPQSKRVFIVHGHDSDTKQTVARFIEQLGLEPIILHEQPSSGRTVIEKLESHSNVSFAVVLLTPDDTGGVVGTDPAGLRGRARQNVILELGYFLAKLSRNRVCALHKENVEIPSDYPAIYIPFDANGAWRQKLAQELVEAKFPIKLEALLKS